MQNENRLWPELISFGNLLTALKNAAGGKRGYEGTAQFEKHLESNLLGLQDQLRLGT